MIQAKNKIVFSPHFKADKISQQCLNEIGSMNFEEVTTLFLGRWQQLNLPQIAPHIQSWPIHKLNAQSNQQTNILKQIKNIQFTKLMSLDLKLNRIDNLEPLTWLHSPFLIQLFLDSNQIFSVKPLRNCKFPLLKQLSLASNKITDFQTLSELKGCKLQRIYLQWFVGLSSLYSINNLAKLQANALLNIWIQHPQRIIQKQAMKSIKRKYPTIRFQTFTYIALN